MNVEVSEVYRDADERIEYETMYTFLSSVVVPVNAETIGYITWGERGKKQ